MRIVLAITGLCLALSSTAQLLSEAPAGFDDKSNDMVDEATH